MFAGALAHRAILRLKNGEPTLAFDDIRECLRCMRENDYVHFFTWTPQLMRTVLEIAVKNDIEVDYARYLARKRLGFSILSNGETIPLLQITTLGELTIGIESQVRLHAEDLTPAQRELLALLVAAPTLTLSLAKIQEFLWPNNSPEKARANMDNLLMRLRKTLNTAIRPSTCTSRFSTYGFWPGVT